MNNEDTILALSTPPGRGGIGIIRMSGKLVPIIAVKLLGKIPIPRKAEYLSLLSKKNSTLDKVISLFFPEPYSFTGENILEIHGHGGQIILDMILERILQISSDIRLANPGEFTKRAFLNGKIDLIQAEAIADMINATSHQAAQSASNSLQGFLSVQINTILKKLTNLRVHIESSIDFSSEEINTISYDEINHILKEIIHDIKKIKKSAYCGIMLRDGIKIVITGKPNAGKSTLFNLLIGMNRAIVSEISGTTRDTLHENIQLDGITAYIIDTAGLQNNSINEIEKMGVERAKTELKNSDHILWVIDSNDSHDKNFNISIPFIKNILSFKKQEIPVTLIRNKSDLSKEPIGIQTIKHYTCITLSALQNKGIDILKTYLSHYFKTKINTGFNCHSDDNQGYFIARKRHLNILKKSIQHLEKAYTQLISTNETKISDLFAEELKLSHNELNKILGKFTTNDLLKEIFSKFCIGK